jgi:hypothetical protein
VTDPNHNDTLHLFSGTPNTSCARAEIETDNFTGSYTLPSYAGQCSGEPSATNLLKSMQTTYIGTGDANLAGIGGTQLPQTQTTIWPNGQTAETAYTYDFSQTWTDYNYELTDLPVVTQNFTTGSVLNQTTYDYGQCTPGALLQQKQTRYTWQDNPSFLNANFLAQVENTCVPSAGNSIRSFPLGMA